MTFGNWAETARRAALPVARLRPHRRDAADRHARQGARRVLAHHRRSPGGARRLVPSARWSRISADKAEAAAALAFWDGTTRPRRRARHRARAVGARHDARPRHPQRASRTPAARCARARATSPASGRRCSPIARRSATGSRATRPASSRPASSTTFTAGASSASGCAAPGGTGVERRRRDGRSRSTPRTTRSSCASTSSSAAGSPIAPAARRPLAYEHLMVDEVQDFSPLELAVLLDTTSDAALGDAGGRHGAGDRARARLLRTGPSCSTSSRSRTSASSRCASATARRARSSTPPSTSSARCMGDIRPVAPRAGAPVESFGFGSAGECAEFLSHALKELVRAEPEASVALLARHPEQARLYYEALARAEVPTLRLVADQDFSFTAGIDVTDVRQIEGARVRHRHPARGHRVVVPHERRRAPPAARRHDPRRPPALGHVHRRPFAPAPGRPEVGGRSRGGSAAAPRGRVWGPSQGPQVLRH